MYTPPGAIGGYAVREAELYSRWRPGIGSGSVRAASSQDGKYAAGITVADEVVEGVCNIEIVATVDGQRLGVHQRESAGVRYRKG